MTEETNDESTMTDREKLIKEAKDQMYSEFDEKWSVALRDAVKESLGHEFIYGNGFIELTSEGPKAVHPSKVTVRR